MNRCRDCIRFEADPIDRRRAGRCTLNGDCAAPGSTCPQFADAHAGFVADLLDWLRADGCEPHLIPGSDGPRLAVRLSADSMLNAWASRNRRGLIAALSRASSTRAAS
ncbi:hypothetical protein [Plasticicumulans sp.]|uniref:hypothetical protein n=1 Tax=Plasticicumulans sp. TaxID=2307179 RepID=UPI002BF3F24D|nr:hypothetical protein [Plasticicumulans sp.]